MDKNQLPCAINPSTAVLVDDNPGFLESIVLKVEKHITCQTFSDPQAGLKYIQSHSDNTIFKNVMTVDMESDSYSYTSGQLPVQFDVSRLYTHIYDRNRFGEIAVVVVDFDMPFMNGEAFCRALAALPVKKIMLTGEASTTLAVQLFNEGVIDQFILKGQPDLEEILSQAIAKMQKQYFRDLSYPIIRALATNTDSCLGDPAFTALFEQICHDHNITSYYLLESSGSFLLLDDDAKPTWLIIKTCNEINELADQMADADMPEKLVQAVRKGDTLPYFYNSDEYFSAMENGYQGHLYPAKHLSGAKKYCYFLSDNLPDFPLNKAKILSFNEYLRQI